jgi:hypothetical protein
MRSVTLSENRMRYSPWGVAHPRDRQPERRGDALEGRWRQPAESFLRHAQHLQQRGRFRAPGLERAVDGRLDLGVVG